MQLIKNFKIYPADILYDLGTRICRQFYFDRNVFLSLKNQLTVKLNENCDKSFRQFFSVPWITHQRAGGRFLILQVNDTNIL